MNLRVLYLIAKKEIVSLLVPHWHDLLLGARFSWGAVRIQIKSELLLVILSEPLSVIFVRHDSIDLFNALKFTITNITNDYAFSSGWDIL